MRNNKGQAAMEFLMTYGWAILAAIIVIGILGYYYFSSDALGQNLATISSPFYIDAANAQTTGVNLEIRNTMGETYTINNVTVTGCGSTDTAPGVISSNSVTVNIPCTLTEGNNFRGDIVINYVKEGTTLEQAATGQIIHKVTA